MRSGLSNKLDVNRREDMEAKKSVLDMENKWETFDTLPELRLEGLGAH